MKGNILLLVFCCLLLAGCGGRENEDNGTDRGQIRLSSLRGEAGISYFQRQAASFTQNGGELPISLELEDRWEYAEEYRNRVMAEMVEGEGPDILYVSRTDMILMQEKGLLCDLSDMISQETKEVLIPGVLELGTVNGSLVGLVPEVCFTTVGVSNQVWGEDSWSTEELIGVLDTRDDWEYPFCQIGIRPDGESLLYTMFFNGSADPAILNLEQGTCHFDSEEFVHILELCKKYGDRGSIEEKIKEQLDIDERARLQREGEMVAEILQLYGGLDEYSSVMDRLGENGHIVGFPVENGSGNYMESYSYGYLVVNARTEHREEISKFFSRLLDYDNQFTTDGCCVRMDVIENCVAYYPWSGGYVMRCSNDEDYISYKELELKPDGTTYLEEFLAFVESCEPTPYFPSQIGQILSEEAGLFFDGDKSAREAADIIQRRVKLYLDETRYTD